jgi:hypothetical protein
MAKSNLTRTVLLRPKIIEAETVTNEANYFGMPN